MAMNEPFGTVLRNTREQKGYDLNEAARRLRIRPDILRAIEANDFAHMPPRGYARNMVNAYARFLGLNASEITRAYLSEMSEYQMGALGEGYEEAPKRSRTSSRSESGERTRDRSYRSESGRQVYSDRVETRNSVGYADLRSTSQSGRGARPSSGGQPYTNFYSGNHGGVLDFIKDKWIFFAGAIVVVLLIVLVVNVISCATAKPEEETPTVPITGVTDTTGTTQAGEGDASTTTTPTVTETAPTSANFTYKVASGATAYVQVVNDGKNVLDGDVSDSQSYEVTGKLTFMTDSPNDVTCTVDGEKVKLKENSIGLYEYSVDFAKILSDWQSEHPSAGTTTGTTAGTTSGTTGTTGTTAGTTGTGTTAGSTGDTASSASSAGTTGTTGTTTGTTGTTASTTTGTTTGTTGSSN